MKKMLVLGSDYYTLSVVKEAKKQNCYVIVTDLMVTSPTKEAADEAWMISTADIDTLEEKCIENNIEAIMYGASDFNVEKGRTLCKRLNLPIYCENDTAWEASRNKYLFKQACLKNGVPVATDYSFIGDIDKVRFNDIVYPVVVKPIDKSGNRGITFCENEEELISAIQFAKEISDREEIIIERRLFGTEHHVNYVVGNGDVRLISFAETSHSSEQETNIYSFEKTTTHHLQEYLNEVNEPLKKTFKDLGCTEGMVWVDTMWDENDGKFYVLEMGYRFAAALASCEVCEKASGFNAIRWMVECSLGKKHMATDMPRELKCSYNGGAGLFHVWSKKEGIITKIEGIETINAMDDVFIDMPKREGSSIRAYSCIALISFYGKNIDELLNKMKTINSVFKVFDEDDENIVIYYDDYKNVASTYQERIV